MADYNDLTTIEQLHAEQAQLTQALTILDDHNGTVTMFSVAAVYSPAALPPPAMVMPVTIMTVDPSQNLMAGVRASCVQRYNAINAELRALGVTGGPPDHAPGGGPPG